MSMQPGIYPDMPMADYQALPFLSSGLCRRILTPSPLHAWTASRLNPAYVEEERQEFDLGTAAHSFLLEGGAGLAVINPEDYRSKPTKASPEGNVPKGWTNDAIREARDNARSAGKSPVLPPQMADIEFMAKIAREAIRDCKDLSGLTLDDFQPEVTLIWQEGETWCKARPDALERARRDVMLDYKSTTSAVPRVFQRQINSMGYHIQDAFYRRGLTALTNEESAFIFLAQENVAPYRCTFHGIAPSLKQIADGEVERAIRTWTECLRTGVWPSYPLDIHWAEATAWQMADFEEAENDVHV